MTRLTLSVVIILISLNTWAQCYDAIPVEELPFSHSFCVGEDVETLYSNPYTSNTVIYGCWSQMPNSQWYLVESNEFGGVITMTVESDLTNPFSPNTNYVHTIYAVFNSCPEDGGTILSYPCNCFNPQGECWDEFGGNDSFIQSSCVWTNIATGVYHWECQGSEPWWNYGGANYQITFELEPNTSYWFSVFPPMSVNPYPSYGCIDVTFEGANILGLPEFCEVSNNNGVISVTEGNTLLRSTDLIHWEEVESPDRPTNGVWYYKACDKVWAFRISSVVFMEFDFIGRRIK